MEESGPGLARGKNMTTAKCRSKHKFDRIITTGMLALFGLFWLSGCSSANYGGFKHSRDVAQAFETYHVFEEHRYYFLNTDDWLTDALSFARSELDQ